MNGENATLFKVFRVLWFPLSLNAMALGAAAVLLFFCGTWLGSLTIGESGLAGSATRQFPSVAWHSILALDWPGGAAGSAVFADYAVRELGAEERGERAGRAEELERHLRRYGWLFGWQVILFFLLWATFGVAICRILALRVARDEYCALGSAFAYAWRVKLTGILYPVAVLLPVAGLALCNQIAGWLTWIPFLGPILGLILLPLTIIAALLIVLMLVAAVISLGLIPAAIAVERKGTYDSLGKAFNYVFARPLPLILHLVVVVTFIGAVHWLLIEGRLVEHTVATTVSPFFAGADFDRMIAGQHETLKGYDWFFAWLFDVLWTVYRLLVWGTLISFALGAATSLFLILRQDVDGMDYLDVARDPHEPGEPAAEEPAEQPPPGDTPAPGEPAAPADSGTPV